GRRAGRDIDDFHLVPGEKPGHVRDGLLRRAVRGEPEVELDLASVRDDVAGDAADDPDRVQALPVLTVFDGYPARPVPLQDPQYRADGVDRVAAQPGPGGRSEEHTSELQSLA